MDKKYEIIIVSHAIKILMNKESDKFIEWELLKNMEFITFLFFVLGFYDEEKDEIKYFHAIKVKNLINLLNAISTTFFL